MVQNDIHRLHVLLSGAGKIKDALWFCMQSLCAIVQGCSRKLFFACSGNGNGSSWNNRGSNGNYWSSSFNSARNARNLNFNSGGVNPQNNNNRYNGFAVRPVQHTILTILFLLIYGTDTSAAITRSVSGILQREEAQIEAKLCQVMGEKHETEHGRLVRRFILSPLQAAAVKMLHRGLSEEERDFRCRIQRPYSTSPILQLYSWPVQKNVYPRLLFVHKGSRHSLRYRTNKGLLQKGKPELAEALLRDALRHQGLLHAHSQKEALGDRYGKSEEDVNTQDFEGLRSDMGTDSGFGFCDMANRDYSHDRSKAELHHLWISGRLDWVRFCKVYAESYGRIGIAHWKLDKSTLLKRISEYIRSVHEESAEMPVLWQICGRCGHSKCRQRLASVIGAGDTEIPESRIGIRLAYGQTGDLGGASWRGISRCLHKALSDLYLESCFVENGNKDFGVRLFKTKESGEKRQFILGYIQTYRIVQSLPQAPYEKADITNRHIQSRYDQIHRQLFIL